MVKITFMIAK